MKKETTDQRKQTDAKTTLKKLQRSKNTKGTEQTELKISHSCRIKVEIIEVNVCEKDKVNQGETNKHGG